MLLGVDVGGTFTDAVLVGERSAVYTAKVPSTPRRQEHAVLEVVRLVLERAGAAAADVQRFAHGMTVATNALLEGNVARTALLATAGFTDVIELARQARVHLYRLCDAAPAPLVAAELRFAVPERATFEGVLEPLEDDRAAALVDELAAAAPQAVAVCLLHSYAHPQHEQLLGLLLAERAPGVHVSLSSELVGTFREFERTATTALDAALSPLLADYLALLRARADDAGLREPLIMQSSGGLTEAGRAGAHAALTVLSGPAGGVGGALALAALARERDVLCFDMGGTSCDVCVIEDARVPETAERVIAGRPVALPALDIHTVGAGGGSIAWRDEGGALRVGPASAGADPGPACYGRGGTQPTVTDANLLLGRLLADAPLAGGVALDARAAERAVAALARELDMDVLACAEGIARVTEAQMLGALRVMTVERGIDPRGFALLPFGGAGPLHAAALARALGIRRMLVPRASGVLSALGLAAAPPRRDSARTLMLSGRELNDERLRRERAALVAHAARTLAQPPARVRVRHELRYRGQAFELPVHEELALDAAGRVRAEPAAGAGAHGAATASGLSCEQIADEFARAHEQRYGYRDEGSQLELVNMRASVWGAAPALAPRPAGGAPRARERRGVLVIDGEPLDARVVIGELAPGSALEGPCLCALPEATLLVPPGWSGETDEYGTVHLQDGAA